MVISTPISIFRYFLNMLKSLFLSLQSIHFFLFVWGYGLKKCCLIFSFSKLFLFQYGIGDLKLYSAYLQCLFYLILMHLRFLITHKQIDVSRILASRTIANHSLNFCLTQALERKSFKNTLSSDHDQSLRSTIGVLFWFGLTFRASSAFSFWLTRRKGKLERMLV